MEQKIIEGRLEIEFDYNTENGDMVCRNRINVNSNSFPFNILMRAYIAMGATLHSEHQKHRYGITNEDEHREVVSRINSQLGKEDTEEETKGEN